MSKATNAQKPNVLRRIATYAGDVRSELRRVVWPTKKEVLNLSLVVIVTIIFFMVFTLVVDTASTHAIRLIGGIGG